MRQVEAAQTRFHRSLAVGRRPGSAEATIGARTKVERALALFLEDKLAVDEATFAPAPFRRFVFVDPGSDRIYSRHVTADAVLDGQKNLAAVRVEPVPRLMRAGRATGRRISRRRAACRRRGGLQSRPRMSELLGQAHLRARRL